MAAIIPNKEFLKRFASDDFTGAILPQEKALVERKLSDLSAAQQRLVAEKEAVTGGDDWHDGAFRATDNEAKILAEQARRLGGLLHAVVIEFPDVTESRATIGSRVRLDQAGDVYEVEIVGVPFLHDTADLDDVMPCSLESPIAKGVIGKEVGQTALFEMGGRQREVQVLGIDQEAMRSYLEDEIAK